MDPNRYPLWDMDADTPRTTPTLPLVNLNPRLTGTVSGGVLVFECFMPECVERGAHQIRVPIHSGPAGDVDGAHRWHAEGSFPDSLTITPSIDLTRKTGTPDPRDCKAHFFITEGGITR